MLAPPNAPWLSPGSSSFQTVLSRWPLLAPKLWSPPIWPLPPIYATSAGHWPSKWAASPGSHGVHQKCVPTLDSRCYPWFSSSQHSICKSYPHNLKQCEHFSPTPQWTQKSIFSHWDCWKSLVTDFPIFLLASRIVSSPRNRQGQVFRNKSNHGNPLAQNSLKVLHHIQTKIQTLYHDRWGPAWSGLCPSPNPIWTWPVQNPFHVCYPYGFNSMCIQPRETSKHVQKNHANSQSIGNPGFRSL